MINVMKILAFAAAKARRILKNGEDLIAEWRPVSAEGVAVVYNALTQLPVGKTDMSKAELIYAAAYEDADRFDTGYSVSRRPKLVSVEFWRTASGNVVSRLAEIGVKPEAAVRICRSSDKDIRTFSRRVAASGLKNVVVDTVSADVERAYVDSLKDI